MFCLSGRHWTITYQLVSVWPNTKGHSASPLWIVVMYEVRSMFGVYEEVDAHDGET